MLNESNVNLEKNVPLELGYILCKWCGTVVGTIPTNGVKRIHGECPDQACRKATEGGEAS